MLCMKNLWLTAALVLVWCGNTCGQTISVFSAGPCGRMDPGSCGLAPKTGTPEPGPVDAVKGIVAAFKQRPIVFIGEQHWLRQAGDFYVRLVRDPSFQENVQDIVVEFESCH